MLLIESISEGTVTSRVECDFPAVRAILKYEQERIIGSLLYWNAGMSNVRYSMGVDVDAATRRIALVELRLYGNRIHPWPDYAVYGRKTRGVPTVATEEVWAPGDEFCDESSLFDLQLRERSLRIEFLKVPATLRVSLGSDLEMEIDRENRVSAFVFPCLSEDIVSLLVDRYGIST